MKFDLTTKLLPPGKKIVDKRAKRYRPKRTLKKKKPLLFQEIEVWVGLNVKSTGYIVAKVIHEDYIVYKVKNYYSILHRGTNRDILRYPMRLFKPHKKMKNMGYVKELAVLLNESKTTDKGKLLEIIKAFFDKVTEKEEKIDKEKKKASKKK